ncbi:MAG: hypothetical protein ACRDRK_25385 [Pseudonocardia sp.]
MAQETAMHRVDVQGASGGVRSIDAELAVDGIEEPVRSATSRSTSPGFPRSFSACRQPR